MLLRQLLFMLNIWNCIVLFEWKSCNFYDTDYLDPCDGFIKSNRHQFILCPKLINNIAEQRVHLAWNYSAMEKFRSR